MAYFANSTEGVCFDEQCQKCKYGQDEACPIALVQINYNYAACNNETASAILGELVKQDGTCTIFELAKVDFAIKVMS